MTSTFRSKLPESQEGESIINKTPDLKQPALGSKSHNLIAEFLADKYSCSIFRMRYTGVRW